MDAAIVGKAGRQELQAKSTVCPIPIQEPGFAQFGAGAGFGKDDFRFPPTPCHPGIYEKSLPRIAAISAIKSIAAIAAAQNDRRIARAFVVQSVEIAIDLRRG